MRSRHLQPDAPQRRPAGEYNDVVSTTSERWSWKGSRHGKFILLHCNNKHPSARLLRSLILASEMQFVDWCALLDLPEDLANEMATESKGLPVPRIATRDTVDITEHVPRGIWKAMAEEPIYRGTGQEEEGRMLRNFAPLELSELMQSVPRSAE